MTKKTPGVSTNGATKHDCSSDFRVNCDILIVNSEVDHQLYYEILHCVSQKRRNNNVILCLVTHGGLASDAYRVGRYLQTIYDDFTIFVPSFCKSAGTLIACAAQQIIMSPWGEIGPLDAQLAKQDEIAGRRSGLTTRSALADLKNHALELYEHFAVNIVTRSGNLVSFKLASEIAAKAASDMMSNIYSQINPVALGQDIRDLSVASAYCERLNRKYNNVRPDAIRKLVHEYPTHDFVIDNEEAKELFNRIELPSPRLYKFHMDNFIVLGAPLADKRFVDIVNLEGIEVASDDHANKEAISEPVS